jgi:Ni2+-binding GTPase involved in maturation of urease and hydrogenase
MNPPRYIMVGGFLGAGKTTALNRFARYLQRAGRSVGLITNDQAPGLVDTAIGRAAEFPTEEIAGGCFCCRFGSLVDAARALRGSPQRPDMLLAEPVGSCTDLVATVALPLQQIYGDDYSVAPFSVLVDPVRAARVLGLRDDGKRFSPNVVYIYRKQLEEAEFIVVNKSDLLDAGGRARLCDALAAEFPEAAVFVASARTGEGLEGWFEAVLEGELSARRFLDIDYARYADGEALLGWLNAAVTVRAPAGGEFDGNALLRDLAAALHQTVADAGLEVAHLKMTLNPQGDPLAIAAVNLVRSDGRPELSHSLDEPLESGDLLVNIRAEADPADLESCARAALDEVVAGRYGLACAVENLDRFRPAPPVPTHRVTA